MQKTTKIDATQFVSANGKPQQWAYESARIASGELPDGRYAKLAAVLLDAQHKGAKAVSFATVNEATGAKLGANAADIATGFVRRLRKLRQLAPGMFDSFAIDAEKGAVTIA